MCTACWWTCGQPRVFPQQTASDLRKHELAGCGAKKFRGKFPHRGPPFQPGQLDLGDAQPAGELGDHSYFAYWNVEGVDDLYREFVAKGALVSSAPTNKPWGLREFGLRTPDGHRIVCGERI